MHRSKVPKSFLQLVADKVLPDIPLWKELVRRVPAHPSGKALIQPQSIPEVHGHEVAKPLVCKFMLYHWR